jgi:hypothetical protein
MELVDDVFAAPVGAKFGQALIDLLRRHFVGVFEGTKDATTMDR